MFTDPWTLIQFVVLIDKVNAIEFSSPTTESFYGLQKFDEHFQVLVEASNRIVPEIQRVEQV